MGQDCYSTRLDDAIALATDSFRQVVRKGSGVPYLSHLLQVTVYVAEAGGDEDQMIAAVLHDYLEDIDSATFEEVEGRFGERVARLVDGLSDAVSRPKGPWKQRKDKYLLHLRDAPAELKLISCADKLHNAESIHRDFHTVGELIWDRFSATREQTLWYYRSVTQALANEWENALLDRLQSEVLALHDSADEPCEL